MKLRELRFWACILLAPVLAAGCSIPFSAAFGEGKKEPSAVEAPRGDDSGAAGTTGTPAAEETPGGGSDAAGTTGTPAAEETPGGGSGEGELTLGFKW